VSERSWPSVSVVMPVLNEAHNLQDAVRSVSSQEYSGRLEICLALGPSSDLTDEVALELARCDSRILLVHNPTGGRSSGLNIAVSATSGDYVVRVDGHSILPPGYIATAVAIARRTGAANVGGVQHAVGTSTAEQGIAAAMNSPFGLGPSRFRVGGEPGPVDTVFLGTFERSALTSVGGFAEDLEGNEDYELNIRLRRAGHVVWFDPCLSIDYRPRPTLGALARQMRNYGRWKRRTVLRHPGSFRPRQVAPLGLFTTLVASLVTLPFSFWGLVVPLAYAAGIFVVSARLPGLDTRARLVSALALPTIHLSWALGFVLPTRSAGMDQMRTAR
jgi:glycosyltransferase involved in cell wall biosynthesis